MIEDGAIRGLACDEWPWPWGDERYRLYEPVPVVVTDGREVWMREDWKTALPPLRLEPFPDRTPLAALARLEPAAEGAAPAVELHVARVD